MFTNTKSNKFLSVFLSIVLVVTLIPTIAFADTDSQSEGSEATEQNTQSDATSENNASDSSVSNLDAQIKNSEATTNSLNDNQESDDSENEKTSSEELQTNSNEANDQANSWRYVDGDQIYSYEGASTEAVDPYATMPLAAAPGASSYATWYKSNGTTSYTYKEDPNDTGQNIAVSGVKRVGIDVSYHQGVIDWAKVKSSGISFAIIRCGFGSDFTNQDDTQFINNVKGAQANGIDIGVYLYSYAMNTTGNDSSASSEAQHVLRLLSEAGLEPDDLAYPVFYDLEESDQLKLGSKKLGQLATTFCDAISAAGYEVGIYSNLNWWTNYLTDSAFSNSDWHKWAARYPGSNKATSSGVSDTEIWQFSDCGHVDGISGNVDMNFDYIGSYGVTEADYAAVYDYDYYVKNNPDVASYYGSDRRAIFEHFLKYGMKEGRASSANFDLTSYYNAYQDLRLAYGTSDLSKYYLHYVNYGQKEGRTCTGVTEISDYISEYNGKDYSAVYDGAFYYQQYEDLREAYTKTTNELALVDDAALIRHFVNYGMKEGRLGRA